MNLENHIISAEKRIRKHTLMTPLLHSRLFSELTGAKVFLKLENEQHTGSFKARGSLNKLLTIQENDRHRGAVTASTGNHALGFARACELADIKGIIFLPNTASKAKVSALKHYPVELKFHKGTSLDTEIVAKQYAHDRGSIWVSPYNDFDIIAGQGTIALELVEQIDQIDYVLVTVGGGGLISGVATMLKKLDPRIKVIGCQPENSPEMFLSVEAGEITQLDEAKDTLSDGSAGGIEPGAITFPICQQLIDEFILITEEEIKQAIKLMLKTHLKIIEGAAGVSLAAVFKEKERFKGKHVVVLICGGNINVDKLIALMN